MARNDTFSQYNVDTIGIGAMEDGGLTDADGDVLVSILRTGDNIEVVQDEVATRDGVGLYSYQIKPSTVTSVKGTYVASWSYEISGDPRVFAYTFEVVDPQPFFDSLSAPEKQMVENVYHHVSDLFDSTVGGPYLWEMPQSMFGFETVAKLMIVDAMTYINLMGPKAFIPPFTFGSLNEGRQFPIGWYGLLERVTAYELYKHLATSYIEIPEAVNVNVARLDRRDYYERWMRRAALEKEDLDHMVKMLKRSTSFGVKSRSLLVAGGIFPVSYLNPARPRWPYVLTRFY